MKTTKQTSVKVTAYTADYTGVITFARRVNSSQWFTRTRTKTQWGYANTAWRAVPACAVPSDLAEEPANYRLPSEVAA